MAKKATKEKTKFLCVKIHCPNLDKEVELHLDEIYFSSSESECGLCGSHGSVELQIHKCECGKSHDIELNSW